MVLVILVIGMISAGTQTESVGTLSQTVGKFAEIVGKPARTIETQKKK
ncbi:hypothetical protein CHISP_3617 [Chitinispirillum alkaliphilum]|nr:hypothetical protein CHISP_3617 [Chitinispirillum alkaliphilum]